MTFLPQKTHFCSRGNHQVHNLRAEGLLPPSNVPLPSSYMSELFTILFFVPYLWAALLFSCGGGLGDFHHRFNFRTDQHAPSDTYKERCSTVGGNELFFSRPVCRRIIALLLIPTPSASFFRLDNSPNTIWPTMTNCSLYTHSIHLCMKHPTLTLGETVAPGLHKNVHANWRTL